MNRRYEDVCVACDQPRYYDDELCKECACESEHYCDECETAGKSWCWHVKGINDKRCVNHDPSKPHRQKVSA